MSVYGNQEILQAIREGHIVFHPYRPEHINGSSVDVTLGYNFYATDRSTQRKGLYNPYDKEDVKRYFGEPLVAKPLRENDYFKRRLGLAALKNIDPEHPVIILRPGERILAHTHEFIGIKPPGTSSLHARSTTGRNGVAVCIDAGWGDPGFISRWTMEIKNLNEDEHVPLPVGVKIAQVVFHHTGPVIGEYANLSGKYQQVSSDNLEDIIKTWQPSRMLPKAYEDKLEMPEAIPGVEYL